MKRIQATACVLILLLGWVTGTAIAQQSDTGADLLPASTAAYLEVAKPAEFIDKIHKHPVTNFVLEHDKFKQLFATPEFAAAFIGQAVLEKQIGEPLLDSLKTNLGEGLYFAFDAKTEGAIILFKSKNEADLKRLAGAVLNLVGLRAAEDGNEVPFKKDNYRDAAVAKFDDLLVARYESWFLISNKPDLAKNVVDILHDGSSNSLARQKWFKSALKKKTTSDAWAAINLETIRNAETGNELFSGRTNDPGLELIFGGILDALKHAPLAVGDLNLDQEFQISVSLPFDAQWANTSREFFFGKNLKGRGPMPLVPQNTIANLTSYRDVGGWWLSKEDLFEENVIAELAKADSELSTIFSGMDFGQDVLGALEPEIQIVVADNNYEEKYVPDIHLPAFALVGRLKNPDKIRRRLKIAFQSVIGFANINLGMQGQPQLDLETETVDDAKVTSAKYFFDDETENGLLLFNFAPTIAFRQDLVIISSTYDLAMELIGLAEGADELTDSNTILQIDGQYLARILAENREPLIAQNMLEKGHERKAAENEIDILLAMTRLLKDGKFDFRVEPDEMKLDITIRAEH